MADPTPYRDPTGDAAWRPARGSFPGTPRWVKLFGMIALVAVLVIVGVMLLAGGEHAPGRHTGSVAAGSQTANSSIAVAGVGGPAEASDAARTVEITTLDTMAFEPDSIDVAAGETVTFVVTNSGQAVHEFTLGDAAMQQEHADEMGHMPGGMAHDLPNSITLQPGETKSLTWRFGDAGSLEYACHEPGHYGAGMRGRISVT